MGISAGPNIVRDSSLVLDLDASDRNSYISGSLTWKDVSGNANNGTLTNGPTFNSTNSGTIVFDGSNDYVSSSLVSTQILSNNQFTANYWLQITGSARGDFFNIKNFNTLVDDIGFYIESTNKLTAYFKVQGTVSNNGVGGGGTSISNTTLSRNTIYNITCMKDASQKIVMYINGVLDNNTYSSATNTANVASSSLWIGSNRSGTTTPSFPFIGNIYNVQIYNRALSQSEVTQNYNALKSRFGLR
jgi:hypothetical protein